MTTAKQQVAIVSRGPSKKTAAVSPLDSSEQCGVAGLSCDGDRWWADHRNDPLDKDFFATCLAQMAGTYMAALSLEQMQVLLDLFRADCWINRHFRDACNWLVRHSTRMPSYADFIRWWDQIGPGSIPE